MTSKKFRNKLCVYCDNGISETGDHIIARKFVLEKNRANLPKVPCCRKCNEEKSRLEHYLTSVLPFGGRHSCARDSLVAVKPRVARNKKLRDELANGWRTQGARISTNWGISVPTTVIPFDSGRLCNLATYVALGLSYYHYDLKLTPKYETYATWVTGFGDKILIESFYKRFQGDTL
ncbi:MAG: HNH endonuclease, partial [Rhizobiaceae bacterium]|nr:HNH endonuclease [Rhizobiaceae bacterium]